MIEGLRPFYFSTNNSLLVSNLYMKEENVYVELTWNELETVLSALRAIKNMVDNDRLDAVYVKLSTQYKGS